MARFDSGGENNFLPHDDASPAVLKAHVLKKVARYDRRLKQRQREKKESSRKGRKDSSQRQNHTSSHLAVSRIGNRRSMFSPSRSLLLPPFGLFLLLPVAPERVLELSVSFSAISLPVRKEKTKDTSMRSRRSRRCFHCNGVPGPSLPLPSQPAFLRDLLLSSLSKRPNFCLGVRAVKGRDYVANGSDHPPRSNRKTARAGFCTFLHERI